MDNLLKEFKARMKIFYDIEDEELTRVLESSKAAIKRMTGTDNIDNDQVKELIIERSRYSYNDSIEYFEDNFQSMIIGVSMEVPNDETDV